MKNNSCFIQILVYTCSSSNPTIKVTGYLLRHINKGYTRINTPKEI